MNLADKLRLIREGTLILEAPEDKYTIPEEENTDETPEPTTSDSVEDPPTDDETTEETPAEDEPETTDEGGETEDDAGGEGSSNYDLDDTSGDTTEGETSTEETPPTDQSDANKPKPGEMLNLDPNSRKILAYKNITKYRTLRDSVSSLVSELTETPTTDDYSKSVITTCITKSSELLEKLNTYITHRYKANSYEVNYKNYADFVLEKRIIEQILLELDKNTDKK